MTRSLGVVDDCPVPLDNAVTINRLWRGFEKRVDILRHAGIVGPILPSISSTRNFNAYNRYMTAILVWRKRKNAALLSSGVGGSWTTTDVETTIFGLNPIIWI